MPENPWRRAAFVVQHLLTHLFVFSSLVVGAVGVHHLIEWLGDPKLFGLVPWTMIADISDMGLLVSLLVYGTISFKMALTEPMGGDEQ